MKKVTFTQDPKSGYQMDMKIAEDCVVIAGNFCPTVVDMNLLIQEVKATGKDKVVIVGDCHESDHNFPYYGEEVIDTLAAAGIECKWLEGSSNNIQRTVPGFSDTTINTFAEAENFRMVRNLLRKTGRRVGQIQVKMENESVLLARYPVVAKVKTIESHDHNSDYSGTAQKKLHGRTAFNTLFGSLLPNVLTSSVNAVMLLNPANNTGLLVTKSQEIEFTLARPQHFDLEILQGRSSRDPKHSGYTKNNWGSVRINVGEGSTELSIYCEPGVWTVKSHPKLDTTDPDVHYVPMWQRVEKVK